LWQQPCSSIGSGRRKSSKERRKSRVDGVGLGDGLVYLTGVMKNKDRLDMHEDTLAIVWRICKKYKKGGFASLEGQR
jgi:hypothetical protein